MKTTKTTPITVKREQEKRECPLCSYIVVNPLVRTCPRCNTSIPFEDSGCASCIHSVSCPSVAVQSTPYRH